MHIMFKSPYLAYPYSTCMLISGHLTSLSLKYSVCFTVIVHVFAENFCRNTKSITSGQAIAVLYSCRNVLESVFQISSYYDAILTQ